MGEQPAGFVPEIDMKLFDPVIAGIRAGSGLVEALHATQDAYGYLPRVALENIADETHLPFSRVFGVASFYAQFRLTPVGKHVIDVCMGTACHVAGAPLVAEAFARSSTSPSAAPRPTCSSRSQTVNCIGACALAPAVRIGDEETHGRVTPQRGAQARPHAAQEGGLSMRPRTAHARRPASSKALKAAFRPELATGRRRHGQDPRLRRHRLQRHRAARPLSDALTKELAKRGLSDKVAVVLTGCHGLCQEGPIAVVHPKGVFYPRLKPKDIAEIVETSVVGDGVVERLLYKRPRDRRARSPSRRTSRSTRGQTRIVRALNGNIDPHSIDDYLSRGGYAALAKVLDADDPEAVIDEVETQRPARPRRRRLPHRAASGASAAPTRARSTTSSATATRATPARSWTAPSSRATRTA